MGSQHKKKKGTDDSRIIIADIKKDADQDAIRTVLQTGIELLSPGVPNVPPTRASIDFVNVTESIDPSQTAGSPGGLGTPSQVTGLTATPSGNTNNLSWSVPASTPAIINYNVYRSTTNGFTPTSPIATPVTNSYPDTGLAFSTTYYYIVSASNANGEGLRSSQASGTIGAPPAPPGQTVGLIATAVSNTQINLSWTASTSPYLANYKVYRGPTGFTPGPSFLIAQPTSNSYSNSPLVSGTTYYYKVSAIDIYSQEGTASTQAQATTTGSPPAFAPNLWYEFNGSFADSSGNGHAATGFNSNGIQSISAFGSGSWGCNAPVNPYPSTADVLNTADVADIRIDTAVGFSVSFWIYVADINYTTGTARSFVIGKADDASNKWSITLDNTGVLEFAVQKAGIDYRRKITGITTGSFIHIAGTFNGSSNVVELYKNAVSGSSSTTTPEYPVVGTDGASLFMGRLFSNAPGVGLFKGYYDEIQYYKSHVLTLAQVTNLRDTNSI